MPTTDEAFSFLRCLLVVALWEPECNIALWRQWGFRGQHALYALQDFGRRAFSPVTFSAEEAPCLQALKSEARKDAADAAAALTGHHPRRPGKRRWRREVSQRAKRGPCGEHELFTRGAWEAGGVFKEQRDIIRLGFQKMTGSVAWSRRQGGRTNNSEDVPDVGARM